VRALAPATLAALLLVAAPAGAASLFPARTGESGILDVPDAEVAPVGSGLLGAEFRLDAPKGQEVNLGALPLYVVGGVAQRLEAGLSVRKWGQPGDPVPERIQFGGALKYQLLPAGDRLLGLALDGTLDDLNGKGNPVLGSRLIASTPDDGHLRFAAFVGGEAGGARGLVYGGALTVLHRSSLEAVLEGLQTPRGANLGAAIRWRLLPTTGMALGFNYLPKDGYQVTLGFSFGPGPKEKVEEPEAAAAPPAAAPAPEQPAYATDRPEFRLRLRTGELQTGDPRHTQYAPWAPPPAAGAGMPGRPPPKTATLSLDDVLEAQAKEAEAQADARERRVRAAMEKLDGREKAAELEARRLDEREQDLRAREQALDARERKLPKSVPTQGQRQLESQEAQLAVQERQLEAQERGFAPALDAAQGTEADAAARADLERQEVNRLAASVSSGASRAEQAELRKQAAAARGRQLTATEAVLVARGERLDQVERQLRTRGQKLDARQRRLDTRAERLDLLERRTQGAVAGPEAGQHAGEAAAAKGAKDKAVFVMVVKSPTAVLKEGAAAGAEAGAGAAAGAAEAIHPGVAVEKAVAAATVITFASPTSQLSELDRETLDSIARVAAREHCELLVWARAKDPGLMAEAQRRANEIKSRAIEVGPLDPKQVVTRITTRPGAPGVDVVVSALRDKPAGAAPGGAAPALAPAAPTTPVTGEAGRREIRDAVIAAQPSIEACVGQVLAANKLGRAEGTLKLTVSAQGRVLEVATGDGDLTGAELERCLTEAARAWKFPAAPSGYSVDVPITIIRGGASR